MYLDNSTTCVVCDTMAGMECCERPSYPPGTWWMQWLKNSGRWSLPPSMTRHSTSKVGIIYNMQSHYHSWTYIIGERERANLVVRSSGFFYLHIRQCTSCKCACAALYVFLFIRNYFIIFTHFHTRCLAIWADRSSQRENFPPFDGMPFCSPANRSVDVPYACNGDR